MSIKRKIEFVFVYQYMLLYSFIHLSRNIKDITEKITESIVSAYQDYRIIVDCFISSTSSIEKISLSMRRFWVANT